MSIRTKLIVSLSIVLVLAFVSLSLVNYVVSTRRYHASTVDEVLPLLTNNILSEIQRDLMMPIHVSSLMANDTFLKDWSLEGETDTGEVERYLSEIRAEYGFFTAFFVSGSTGRYYYHDGILKTMSHEDPHDDWYYAFKSGDQDVTLEVDTNEASNGVLTVFINHRLVDSSKRFLGVTGVGLAMSSVQRILSTYQAEYGRAVYMVDSSGLVQAHLDPSLVMTTRLSQIPGIASVAAEILAQEDGAADYEIVRGRDRVFVEARYFPTFDWYLIVEQESGPTIGRIRSALLANLAVGLVTTCLVILVVVVMVNHFQGRLESLISTDELTHVVNRRELLDRLESEANRAHRHRHLLAFLMIDADHFKSINDNHGHLTGDKALVMLAETMQRELRDSDILGRLGGEEFGVILPETGLGEAIEAAERIRSRVEARELPAEQGSLSITVSIGVAVMHPDSPNIEDLLRRADAAMYRAKAQGRNCVVSGLPSAGPS